MTMLDFILKYWLEVLFGLVCAGIAWLSKHYITLMKEDRKRHQDDIIKVINQKMDDQYTKTQQQMDSQYLKTQQQMDTCYKNLNTLIEKQGEELKKVDIDLSNKITSIKSDVLSIEGAYFKSECRKLLQKDHVITEEEFNTISVQHIGYNGLGGNHEGDALFESVKLKYNRQEQNS